jgi:hypothetical protein
MALTAEQYQELVILQVGDDAAGTLAANIALLWARNDDRSDNVVRFLYTKRDAIDVMLAGVRKQVTFKALDGASVNLSDLMRNLQQMRDDVQGLIDEQALIANGAGAIGALTTTAPIPPPPFWPDANDPRYKGDPYEPRPPQIGRTPE